MDIKERIKTVIDRRIKNSFEKVSGPDYPEWQKHLFTQIYFVRGFDSKGNKNSNKIETDKLAVMQDQVGGLDLFVITPGHKLQTKIKIEKELFDSEITIRSGSPLGSNRHVSVLKADVLGSPDCGCVAIYDYPRGNTDNDNYLDRSKKDPVSFRFFEYGRIFVPSYIQLSKPCSKIVVFAGMRGRLTGTSEGDFDAIILPASPQQEQSGMGDHQ